MPFRPGDAKPANSGRKKGSPAKPTTRTQESKLPPPKLSRDVSARLEALGLDPIAGLVRVGVKAEEAGELGIAKACYAELANYVWPKRRALEHSGTLGMDVTLHAKQILRDRIAGIRERLGAGPGVIESH